MGGSRQQGAWRMDPRQVTTRATAALAAVEALARRRSQQVVGAPHLLAALLEDAGGLPVAVLTAARVAETRGVSGAGPGVVADPALQRVGASGSNSGRPWR